MRRFFDYTEGRTKITSLFAFATAMLYRIGQGEGIRPIPSALFFCAMLLFDLATTAINNYIDSAGNGHPLPYDRKTARHIIFALLAAAGIFGLCVSPMTDLVVLGLGTLCFACGILYTYGPLPISRMPLGEVVSGIFYGCFIPFLVVYINAPEGSIIGYGIESMRLSVSVDLPSVTAILLLGAPLTLTTAGIMLANNICDLEQDILHKRFTLLYHIGKARAVKLYRALYRLCFLLILLAAALGVLPPISLGALLVFFGVDKNIRLFEEKQIKAETFVTSIRNFLLINGAIVIALSAELLIDCFV